MRTAFFAFASLGLLGVSSVEVTLSNGFVEVNEGKYVSSDGSPPTSGPYVVVVEPGTLGTSRASLQSALSTCGSVTSYLPPSSWLIHVRENPSQCLEGVSTVPGYEGAAFYPPSLRMANDLGSATSSTQPLRAVSLTMAAGTDPDVLAADLAAQITSLCPSCKIVRVKEGEVHLTALQSCPSPCDYASPVGCGCTLPIALAQAAAAHPSVVWVAPVSGIVPFNAGARAIIETTDIANSPSIRSEFGACADVSCSFQSSLPISQLGFPPLTSPPATTALLRALQAPPPSPGGVCSAACASLQCGNGFSLCSSSSSGTTGGSTLITPISTLLNGNGQLIQVIDTGLDYTSPFFLDPTTPVIPTQAIEPLPAIGSHRKIATYWSYVDGVDGGSNSGPNRARGHGTHVAGSIAGNAAGLSGGALLPGDAGTLTALAGAAPGARLLVTDVGCDSPDAECTPASFPARTPSCNPNQLCPPDDVTALFSPARTQGARITSAAWGTPPPIGGPSTYSAVAVALDSYVATNPDHLLVFSAGDTFGAQSTITLEGMAKNVLTVGGINDGMLGHTLKTRGAGALYQPSDGRACRGIISNAAMAPLAQPLTPPFTVTAQGPACPTAATAGPALDAQCYNLFQAGLDAGLRQSSAGGTSGGGFPTSLDPLNDPEAFTKGEVPYALGQVCGLGASDNTPGFCQAEVALCCGCSLQSVVNGAPPELQQFLRQAFQLTYNARWTSPTAAKGPASEGTNFRIKPDVVAPSLDIISARSSGFGTGGSTIRPYGSFLCNATSTFDPVADNQVVFAAPTLISPGANTVWSLDIPTPTTEPVRILAVNLPNSFTPTGGVVYVSLVSTSETQPTGPLGSLTPWKFEPVEGGLPGQGPYQMAPVPINVSSSTAPTTIALPVGYDLGAGWTGRILVHPSVGMSLSVAFPGAQPNPATIRQRACFAPTATGTPTSTSPTGGGVSLGSVRMTLDLARGGPWSYISPMTGTSSAAALMAGEAALVRQYFMGGFFPSGSATPANGFIPSAALLKATLINSASPLSLGTFDALFGDNVNSPSNAASVVGQGGFGVPNLVRGLSFATLPLGGSATATATRASNAIPTLLLPGLTVAPGFPLEGVDPTLSTQGQTQAFCVDTVAGSPVGAGVMPLSITLVWTDPPGSPAAAFALVNNLDLVVTLPSGARAYGNSNITSLKPNPNAQFLDARNNVEVVTFASPVATLSSGGSGGARLNPAYTISIRATSLPMPPQSFSLVVTGPGVLLGVLSAGGVCTTGVFPPVFPGGGGGATPGPAPANDSNNNATILTISIATSAALGLAFLITLTVAIVLYYRQASNSSSSSSSTSSTTARSKPSIKSPSAWGEGGGSVSTSNALRNATGNTEIELAAVSPSSKVSDWAGGNSATPTATAAKV